MTKTRSVISIIIILLLTASFAYVGINGMPIGKYDVKPLTEAVQQGLDLRGGVYALYEAQTLTSKNLIQRCPQLSTFCVLV